VRKVISLEIVGLIVSLVPITAAIVLVFYVIDHPAIDQRSPLESLGNPSDLLVIIVIAVMLLSATHVAIFKIIDKSREEERRKKNRWDV